MTAGSYDRGSFRDPTSRVSIHSGRVQRVLTDRGGADWHALRAAPSYMSWVDAGMLVGSEEITADQGLVLEHPTIPFWTYPYEWTFGMLQEAALLHLKLLAAALAEGLTLKDATPYNVQFVGTRPIFIDVGSFRPLEAGEPWLGYRQFCQLFLYPLLASSHAGLSFQPLLRGNLEGITPGDARAILSGHKRKPGVLTDVMLQARADRKVTSRDVRTELSEAGFKKEMILANISRLEKLVSKLEWSQDSSTWSEYASCDHVATQRTPKAEFVREVAGQTRRHLVWDLGANDGHHSIAVADLADHVLAIDGDALVLDRLFKALRREGPTNVLPVVMDLSNPSPGLGWRGQERKRLEERGRPDLVLMLAVVHHLVIGANLPLTEVINWLATLGSEVVFEWVPPEDPMSKKLATNKRAGEIHADYHEDICRNLLAEHFVVNDERHLEGRILFHLIPRS